VFFFLKHGVVLGLMVSCYLSTIHATSPELWRLTDQTRYWVWPAGRLHSYMNERPVTDCRHMH